MLALGRRADMTTTDNGSAAAVRLPGDAVAHDGQDVAAPAAAILERLNVLPPQKELDDAGGPGTAFGGPPQSVAVIEATATALSKWWAVGLGVSITAAWGSVVGFWNTQQPPTQRMVLLTASIATAALALAIGYIVGSDVRGRAAATVATVEARARIAEAVIRRAEGQPPAPTTDAER